MTVLETILAPLDGTPASETGLAWARYAALRAGARLELLMVVDPEKSAANGHVEEARTYLGKLKEQLTASGVAAGTEVAIGCAGEEILARAGTASLTVMTCPATRWLFGGALDVVMRSMTNPVVVVRGQNGRSNPEFDTQKVLVPLDQSSPSRFALPAAIEFCRQLGASLVLLNVVPPAAGIPNVFNAPPELMAVVQRQVAEAESLLEQAAVQPRKEGVPTETVVAVGDPAREIIRAAREVGAGLIAMATTGNSSLSMMMGSLSLGVVQASPLPCLLVRPPKSPAAE